MKRLQYSFFRSSVLCNTAGREPTGRLLWNVVERGDECKVGNMTCLCWLRSVARSSFLNKEFLFYFILFSFILFSDGCEGISFNKLAKLWEQCYSYDDLYTFTGFTLLLLFCLIMGYEEFCFHFCSYGDYSINRFHVNFLRTE